MTEPLPVLGSIRDLCSDDGFQWEFGCRSCDTSYRSPLERNLTGQGRGLLRMAGQWFGGDVARASWTMDSYDRGYSGPSDGSKSRHYAKAVAAVLPNFRQCTHCNRWQCAHACWNATAERCTECAPVAAAPAADITRLCPSCGKLGAGRFCQYCGAGMATASNCPGCGTRATPGASFCGDCGTALR